MDLSHPEMDVRKTTSGNDSDAVDEGKDSDISSCSSVTGKRGKGRDER